jgi:outer membrane immunogenic protein
MKKLFLATTALVALAAGSASAADLAARPVYKAPPPAPVYSWTGVYWGVNVGYSWGQAKNDVGVGVVGFSDSQDVNGVIGGGQIGINWQVANWVFGFESDIQASGQKGSSSGTIGVIGGDTFGFSADHKLDWFGTSRVRIGFLPVENILLYATGGVAYGQVKSSYTVVDTSSGSTAALDFKDTRAGWTVGAGIEGLLGGGWSAKLEYLYVDLGKNTTSAVVDGATIASFDSKFTDNIVRVGLNYKFGSGGLGPIAARY